MVLATLIVLLGLSTFSPGDEQGTTQGGRGDYRAALTAIGISDSGTEAVKCGLPHLTMALHGEGAREPHIAAALATLLDRPAMQTSRAHETFRVHYDTTGLNTPALLDATNRRIPGTAHAYVDSVLSMLAYLVPLETEILGYDPPPQDGTLGGGPEYDIYVMELGNLYGYTTPDVAVAEGGRSTTFFTVDNDFVFVRPDSNKGLPGLRVTLAHELHHAIQLGEYGYWTNDVYYHEITSTWLEEVAYTEVNDYLNYLRAWWGHFRYPEREFASGTDLIMYSRGIWGVYVSKAFGTHVVRRSWEYCRETRPLDAINRALVEAGSDFASAFAEWTLWNIFTGQLSDPLKYYPEGAWFPTVKMMVVEFTPPTRTLSGSLHPLSAAYYQILTGGDTVTLALANGFLDAALTGQGPLGYSLEIADTRIDNSYQPIGAGLYLKTEMANPIHWSTWSVVDGQVSTGSSIALNEGIPFPAPFYAGAAAAVYIPLGTDRQVSGTLTVYSASMDLIYSSDVTSRLVRGRQAVSWSGHTNSDETAASGVYVYVLNLQDRTVQGKIVVIRR